LFLNTQDAAAALVGIDLLAEHGHEHLAKRRVSCEALAYGQVTGGVKVP
jgi:hypothetical protein